jgi:gluconolactonase
MTMVGLVQAQDWQDSLLQLDQEMEEQNWEGSVRQLDRRLDSKLVAVVSHRAVVEKLADSTGLGPRKGALWIRKGGYLIYSDFEAKKINKWAHSEWGPYDQVSTFLENIEANSLTLDPQGRLVWTGLGQVFRREDNGRRTVLASEYQGKPLRNPTDLVYKSDGALYFTDPGHLAWDEVRKKYLLSNQIPRIFLIRGRKLQLLSTDVRRPSGIAFSPDEKYLYVVSSSNMTITRFELQPDDTIANPQLFISLDTGGSTCYPSDCLPGAEPPNAIKVDQAGNVYASGPGGVWIISPEGQRLGTIVSSGRLVLGLAFGGDDGKYLYMTSDVASGSESGLYRIRLKNSGMEYVRAKVAGDDQLRH